MPDSRWFWTALLAVCISWSSTIVRGDQPSANGKDRHGQFASSDDPADETRMSMAHVQHVNVKLPGMTGSSAQLRWEFTQNPGARLANGGASG
ncbi:MAG: hypothetical protein JWL71_3445 [Acidobacteria bacterium]|nr:hypothetical protein [Acidobacteriota bacterium]